jgi:hypothetical protein
LAERWRKPVIPLDIDQVEQGIWLPDGRIMGEVQLTLTETDIGRIRAGYVCVKCLEPHEQAWPEHCQACGAPMRSEQAAYFAREFGGEVKRVPRPSWEEELGGLEERRRKSEEGRIL